MTKFKPKLKEYRKFSKINLPSQVNRLLQQLIFIK